MKIPQLYECNCTQGVTCPPWGGDGAPHEQPGDETLQYCAHPVANTQRDPATGHQNEPEGPPETFRSAFVEAIPQTLLRKLSQELQMVKGWQAARTRAGVEDPCCPKTLTRGHRLFLAAISRSHGCPLIQPDRTKVARDTWRTPGCWSGSQHCWVVVLGVCFLPQTRAPSSPSSQAMGPLVRAALYHTVPLVAQT